LFELSAHHDISLARLSEAHVDAVAILHEAGVEPVPDALYAVWASAGPGGNDVRLDTKRCTLTGAKPFCSGCGVVDRALVTADVGEQRLLVDIDVSPTFTMRCGSAWHTNAMAKTWTSNVEFDQHPVSDGAIVGGPNWYLDRPGFWHGAIGPAACWAGGTAGLVEGNHPLADWHGPDHHGRAHYGALLADVWTMQAVLERAGNEIDDRPADAAHARVRALMTRHAIHELCTSVLNRFGRAAGPRPFVTDSHVSQRHADISLYLRQCHGERDLELLGDSAALLRHDARHDGEHVGS
jgi:alkylation response protein AidB-like acyl-CoA dehydrogenase